MFKPNFLTILLIAFVDHMGIGLVFPIFAALLFDPSQSLLPPEATDSTRGAVFGLLIALTPLAQFFSSSILGAFSDRKGRRLALSIGLSVGIFGYALAILGIWFSSLGLLMVYRIAVGISDSTVAVGQAAIADISTDEEKGKRFSLFFASLGFGFTIGPFIGGQLGESFGYSSPFIAAGLLCILNLLLVWFKFPETKKDFVASSFNFLESLQNIRKVFFFKNLRLFFFGGFALSFGWTFFNEFMPVLLRSRFHFSLSEVGDYYAIGGIFFALSSSLGTALLSKRFSLKKIVIIGLMGSSISMLLNLFIVESLYLWCLLPPLMFFLAVAYPTLNAILSNRIEESRQGEILGAYQATLSLAMGLSPLMVGSLVGAYPDLAALGGALTMAIACIAFWIDFRKKEFVLEKV